MPKLASDIDVGSLGSHTVAYNKGSFHQLVRIESQDFSVLASARLRLIGINDEIGGSKKLGINKLTYLPSETLGMKEYFKPEGKPAPPLPLRPESLISSIIHSCGIDRISFVLCQSPRFRAPSMNGLSSLYTLVNILS